MTDGRDQIAAAKRLAPVEDSAANYSAGIVAIVGIPAIAAVVGAWWEHPTVALTLNAVLAFFGGRGWHLRRAILVAGLASFGAVGPALMQLRQPTHWEFEAAIMGGLLTYMAVRVGIQTEQLRAESLKHATTDSLTGLLNRVGFAQRLGAEINRAQRSGSCLAVAFLDGDRFKEVNDRQGHLAGDRFLRSAAKTIARSVRSYDSIARWGGDEFVILFPDSGPIAATVAVSRLQEQLHEAATREGCPVTWSIGVTIAGGNCSAEEIIAAADQLMYEAKRSAAGSLVLKELGDLPETPQDSAPARRS